MKLMLGTAQFGLPYGVSNTIGQTPEEEVYKILEYAKSIGIQSIDTAQLYGNSEEVIGHFPNLNQFSIVTKIPGKETRPLSMESLLSQSLKRLNQNKLYALMFHRPDDLISASTANEDFLEAMKLQEQGLINKIGVSVYNPNQLEIILDRFEIDIVQIPMNILDQRFLKNGLLKKAKDKNVEIHVRSAFLQGLLLMEPSSLNNYFDPIKAHLNAFKEQVSKFNYDPKEVLLAFLREIEEVDRIVVGVNNVNQLKELVDMYKSNVTFPYHEYSLEDESFLLPTNWKLS